MAALIIAIFPQNSSRGNWEEQQDRTDPNSQFELARKPAWLLAFRQFGLPKWKHDFECAALRPLRYVSRMSASLKKADYILLYIFFQICIEKLQNNFHQLARASVFISKCFASLPA
ncbi:hypothetical protein DXC33_09050 [Clostridiaceae bacterium TF01-6]|nr:hypothetical protein DXC33_09050 [Clostridiaceae bacterium TF01-6]